MAEKELYTLTGAALLHETDSAILIEVDDEQIWLPFSQIERITRYPNGAVCDIVMSAWIARAKNLI